MPVRYVGRDIFFCISAFIGHVLQIVLCPSLSFSLAHTVCAHVLKPSAKHYGTIFVYTARDSVLLLDFSKHNGTEVMKFIFIHNQKNVLYRWGGGKHRNSSILVDHDILIRHIPTVFLSSLFLRFILPLSPQCADYYIILYYIILYYIILYYIILYYIILLQLLLLYYTILYYIISYHIIIDILYYIILYYIILYYIILYYIILYYIICPYRFKSCIDILEPLKYTSINSDCVSVLNMC